MRPLGSATKRERLLMQWKALILILTALAAGCIGDRALPIVSSTEIPGSELTVDLGGPDRKGEYHYYV